MRFISDIPPVLENEEEQLKIDFSLLSINHVEEVTQYDRTWIYFQLGGITYYLFLVKNREKDVYIIDSVNHEEMHCPFCFKENDVQVFHEECALLNRQKEELFQKVIGQSSNRLKWLFQKTE